MAFLLPSSPLLLAFSLLSLVLLISPAHALNCASQTFANNKLYTNCTDLPTLSASLHWTYHATNSSLSIAFLAPPSTSNGWISWAINPTGTGMVGAQSLIAFKQADGSMTVKTYNIKSYNSISESKLSFDVPVSSAEYSGGLMKIFATLSLPSNMTTVNQVWQVGGSVTNGVPDKHEFKSANMNAEGKLALVGNKAQVNGTTPGSPSGSPNNRTDNEGPNGDGDEHGTGGSTRMKMINIGLYVFLMFLGTLLGLWS